MQRSILVAVVIRHYCCVFSIHKSNKTNNFEKFYLNLRTFLSSSSSSEFPLRLSKATGHGLDCTELHCGSVV